MSSCLSGLSASELEFCAEFELVMIVPRFNESRVYLMEGNFGPFRPGIPTQVPLWVAIQLRKRQKCDLVTPSWLSVESLETCKESERSSDLFTCMPHPDLFILAQLILDAFGDDLQYAQRVQLLLKDLWDLRQAKLKKSAEAMVKGGFNTAELSHLQLIELKSVRPLLPIAIDHLQILNKALKDNQINRMNKKKKRINDTHDSSSMSLRLTNDSQQQDTTLHDSSNILTSSGVDNA